MFHEKLFISTAVFRMKYLATTLLSCLILGCSTTATFITKVTSDPPRARIEVNNDYIGQTPLELTWEGYKKNRALVSEKVVRALPIETGQQVQIKYFKGTMSGAYWGDTIPNHIFFDMHLATPPNKYELNIK